MVKAFSKPFFLQNYRNFLRVNCAADQHFSRQRKEFCKMDSSTLRRLAGLNLSTEQMSAILELLADIDEREDLRRARTRERVRRFRLTRKNNVTLQEENCNSEETLPLSPKRKVPPHPLKENNPFPAFSETSSDALVEKPTDKKGGHGFSPCGIKNLPEIPTECEPEKACSFAENEKACSFAENLTEDKACFFSENSAFPQAESAPLSAITGTVSLTEKDDVSGAMSVSGESAGVPLLPSPSGIFSSRNFGKNEVPELAKSRPEKRSFEAEFHEIFWPSFPNKCGKPKALTAFLKARKKDSLAAIMAGLQRYIADKPPDRPWLNPTTFLNQERWNDQPAPVLERKNAKFKYDKRSTARKVTDAMARLAPRFDAYQTRFPHDR